MTKKFTSILLITLSLSFASTSSAIEDDDTKKFEEMDYDVNTAATLARNLRSAIRYHFVKANKAQSQMYICMNRDDVDNYEVWLHEMRYHDGKLFSYIEKYDEVRDFIEAKMWIGELVIDNFQKRMEKGFFSSAIDNIIRRGD